MLPGIGGFEYLLLAVLALVVIGPKDLPMLMRKAGAFINRMRGMASEFRASFDEMARQSELDDLRKQVEELRSGQLMQPITDEIQPMMAEIEGDVRTSLSTDWSGQPLAVTEEPDTQPAPKPARKSRTKAGAAAGARPAKAAKAPARAVPKAAARPVAKPAAKPAPRPVAKTPAKAAAKAPPRKPAAKPAAAPKPAAKSKPRARAVTP